MPPYIPISNVHIHQASSIQDLHRVRSQHLSVRSNILGSFVVLLPPKPKQRYEHSGTTGHETRIIHRHRIYRHREREAEYHDKDDDVQTRDGVDDVSQRPFHPEPARRDLGPSA